MYPLLGRLYLYGSTALLADQVMMMLIVLTDTKLLLVVKMDDIGFTVVCERIELAINRRQPDPLTILVEDAMKVLGGDEVIAS